MKNYNSKPDPQAASFTKIILFNLTIILLLVVSSEIYLRQNKDFDYLKNDRLHTFGEKKHINSSGYRDEEFNTVIKKDGSQTLIFSAGGSITYGSGVAWQNVFAKKLQTMLNNSSFKNSFFSINGGNQGNPLGTILPQINKLKLSSFPKIIIISIPASVVSKELKLISKKPSDLKSKAPLDNLKSSIKNILLASHIWLHHNTRSYSLIDQELRMNLFRAGIIKEQLDNSNEEMMPFGIQADDIDETRHNLTLEAFDKIEEKVLALKKKTNATLILLGIPSRFMISDDSIDNLRNIDKAKFRIDPMKKIKSIAEKNGIVYANLKARLVQEHIKMNANEIEWNDLYNLNDYAHLNLRGHEIAAEVLFETIKTNCFQGLEFKIQCKSQEEPTGTK